MKKVLIIDPATEFAVALGSFFKARGIAPFLALDGRQGWLKFQEVQPDLVIMELFLAKLDGSELLEKIRAHPQGQKVPIVIATSVFRERKVADQIRSRFRVLEYLLKPVSLPQIAEVVDRIGGGAGADPVAEAQPFPMVRMPRGQFGSVDLPALLYQVYRKRLTGSITCQREGVSKVIYVEDGRPTYASSNQLADRIGQRLIRDRIITPKQLDEALHRQQQTGKRLVAILTEMGAMGPAQMFEALGRQIREIIHSLFAWDGGEYAYLPERAEIAQELKMDLNLHHLLYEGVHLHTPWHRVQSFLAPSRLRLTLVQGGEDQIRQLPMTPAEAKLLRQLQAERVLGDLVSGSGAADQPLPRFIYLLLIMGLVRPAGGAP